MANIRYIYCSHWRWSYNHAYMTNWLDNSCTQCSVNNISGIKSNTCQTITPTGNGALNIPSGIAFY